MKTFIQFFAILSTVLFCCSCSDQMYVEAPCNLDELNINGSIAQELNLLNDKDAVADQDTGALDFTLNYGTGDSYRVQIFSSDPTQNGENCYILAYYILNDDSTTELLCNLPENINNLYVGVTDKEGNRVVKSVAMLNGKANVVFGTLMASSK
ncbi:MAG: hypothetical protein MJZ83_07785 [Bacteroidaceae bacterium]|nr:hypothetical protein [Bacteroidaceae bacterium]